MVSRLLLSGRGLLPPLRHLGLRLAATGAALQLVGLSWDAVMHHLDSSLAEHEDVLTLANPSHAMFLLGLVVTVAGLALELTARLRQPESRGGRREAALWGGGLVALSAGALAVAISTGGLLSRHGNSPADGHDHELATANPTLPGLLDVLRGGGTEKALDRLDELASKDQEVLAEAHLLAHEIGRSSFSYYKSAPVAFSHWP